MKSYYITYVFDTKVHIGLDGVRITLILKSEVPRLRERYWLGARSLRCGNCFFEVNFRYALF